MRYNGRDIEAGGGYVRGDVSMEVGDCFSTCNAGAMLAMEIGGEMDDSRRYDSRAGDFDYDEDDDFGGNQKG